MKKVTAVYSRDSKNYHMFSFDHKKRIVGRIYVLMGDKIPDVLKIYLETNGEIEREKKRGSEKQRTGKRRG
jgi:hypothetical protein